MTQGNDCISPESLLALLKERRSIRRYRPDPVPDEMVEQLLDDLKADLTQALVSL